MEIGKDITQILIPGLNQDNCISVDEAMQLLEQSKYNLESIGFPNTVEGLMNVMGDLNEEYFEIQNNEDATIIKCKSVPQKQVPQDNIQNQTQSTSEEISTLYRRIGGVIKALLRKNEYPNACVPLTDLGQELRNQGHSLPQGEKISSFLRKEPGQFEILMDDNDTTYVRLTDGGKIQAPIPPQPAVKVQNHMISIYDIFDFAYFSDYTDAKRKLAEMAVQDSWFVIPDEKVKDQYALLDYKLRIQFAMLVKSQLQGESESIKIALNGASFDTGLVSPAGQPIYAYFTLNVQRDNSRWQTYEFQEFKENSSLS